MQQPTMLDLADLTRYLGLGAEQQEAVFSWSGATDRNQRWTEEEAAELAEIWKADTSGAPQFTDVLTVRELATLAHCSYDTARRAVVAGKIPGARQVGATGMWVVPEREGRDWARAFEPYATLKEKRSRRDAPSPAAPHHPINRSQE
jgi:hypothetical protein